MFKDYDITMLYHLEKTNIVVDSLSRKVVSMGSLSLLSVEERPLAREVHQLANSFVLLDIFESGRVLTSIEARSLLIEQIRDH